MDETALKLLLAFAEQLCPEGTVTPEDWQRLNAFTLYVYRSDLKPTARTVRNYLIEQHCSLQKASWASAQYQHFIELLVLYDRQKASSGSP